MIENNYDDYDDSDNGIDNGRKRRKLRGEKVGGVKMKENKDKSRKSRRRWHGRGRDEEGRRGRPGRDLCEIKKSDKGEMEKHIPPPCPTS